MKKIAIILVNFYQTFLSTILKTIVGSKDICRFPETCSEYAKRVIEEKGAVQGLWLSSIRLFKCQPFYKLA